MRPLHPARALALAYVSLGMLHGACDKPPQPDGADLAMNADMAGEEGADLAAASDMDANADLQPAADMAAAAAKPYVRVYTGEAVPEDAAVDRAGGVVIVGSFKGTVDFGGGPLTSRTTSGDAFVLRLDPEGRHLWSRRHGETAATVSFGGVAVDSAGRVIITGNYSGTAEVGGPALAKPVASGAIFLAQYDPDGKHRWSKGFPATQPPMARVGVNRGETLATDTKDDIIVGAFYTGTLDWGGGQRRCGQNPSSGVAKFKSDGTYLWDRTFTLLGLVKQVATDPSDNVIVTGSYNEDIGFGAPLEPNTADAFLLRWGPDGKPITQKGLGVMRPDIASGVAVDSTGAIRLIGSGGGLYLRRYSAALAQEWQVSAEGGLSSVAVDPAGNALVGGSFTGTMKLGALTETSAGGRDIWIGLVSPTGAPRWVKRFGGPGTEELAVARTDQDGHVLAIGTFQQTVDFGDGPRTATGTSMYVVKLRP